MSPEPQPAAGGDASVDVMGRSSVTEVVADTTTHVATMLATMIARDEQPATVG